MAFFNTFYEENFMITVKNFRDTEHFKSTQQQPTIETIEQKTERVLKSLLKEGIEVTPQIRTLVWTQVKEKDDTYRVKKYLQEFKKFGLKPLVNEPPKLKVYTRPGGEDAIRKEEILTAGIYFVPVKAYEALFPQAPWDKHFFKKHNWVSCIVNRSVVERKIPVNEVVNRVVKLAYSAMSENTKSVCCFAFETAESVF